MKYADGRDVAVGDRVKLWQDQCGTVVCSIDKKNFTAEFPESEWGYLGSGVVVQTDTGGLFHYKEADEDFEPIRSRAAP